MTVMSTARRFIAERSRRNVGRAGTYRSGARTLPGPPARRAEPHQSPTFRSLRAPSLCHAPNGRSTGFGVFRVRAENRSALLLGASTGGVSGVRGRCVRQNSRERVRKARCLSLSASARSFAPDRDRASGATFYLIVSRATCNLRENPLGARFPRPQRSTSNRSALQRDGPSRTEPS